MSYFTSSQTSIDSSNYHLARDMGYELSIDQFSELYKYAKMVHNEQFEDPVVPIKSSNLILSSEKLKNSYRVYSEDLWIKYLREYFDSEIRG